MLDLTKAYKIYINGKKVANIGIGESTTIWPPESQKVTLTLLDSFKVKVTQGNTTEIYNLSYTTSPKTPNYVSSLTFVDSAGEKYYLPQVGVPEGDKTIMYEGDFLSNGWYSDKNQSGESYSMWSGHYTRNITNEWYFGYNIENRLATYPINDSLLEEAIRRVNKCFPSAHIKKVASASNYFEMDDYEDTWLALCTSWTTSVRIQFNYTEMTNYYGAFTTDTSTTAYKKWLGTAVHELGHTMGTPDQASHLPSIYDYGRDRAKALYLQSNDIAWIKHAYCDGYGCDPNIFDVDRGGDIESAADVAPTLRKTARAATLKVESGEEECCLNFDYCDFDSIQDIEKSSSNIVTATLAYNRTEKLNIGGDLELQFDIYTINIIDEEKGILTKKELKIHPQENTIKENIKYRLYLKEYKNTPCSLVNVKSGIIEI